MTASSERYEAGLRHLETAAVAWAQRFAASVGARIEVKGWQPGPDTCRALEVDGEPLLLRISEGAVYAYGRACDPDEVSSTEAEWKRERLERRWIARALGKHLHERGFETRDPSPEVHVPKF